MNTNAPEITQDELVRMTLDRYRSDIIKLTAHFLEDQKINGEPVDAASQLRKEQVNSKLDMVIEQVLMLENNNKNETFTEI